MAAPSLALQSEIAALQSALAVNKLAAARARKAQKQLCSGGLGPVGRKVVLCIYIESKYDVDLALRAACRWSSFKQPTDVGYPTQATVQDLFLAASDMDLQNASEPSGSAWAQAARHAKAFLAEAATFSWVKSCNQAGVAPQSMAVFSTWEQKHFGGPLGGAPARRYVNKWVQRFRSKWGLRRRMLRPEVHQDPASVRNKAGKPEPDGPFFGAGKRTQKRVHQYCFNFPGRFQMRSIFGTPGTSFWHCRCPYFGNWSPIMSTPSMQIGKYSS